MTVKTHFNLTPEDYDRLRRGHLARRRTEWLAHVLARHERRRCSVVEIGAGTGGTLYALAMRFPQSQFVGVDIVPDMVKFANEHYRRDNLRFEVRDIINEPLQNDMFDMAFSIDVLHHIHALQRFCVAVQQLMKRSGIWVAIEPNIFHPYILFHQERMRRAGFDEDHFRPWRVEPVLRDAGFVVHSRRFAFAVPGWVDRVPAPVARLERLFERVRLFGGSIVYELRTGGLE
jgi:SAM-dependent methyltransferase